MTAHSQFMISNILLSTQLHLLIDTPSQSMKLTLAPAAELDGDLLVHILAPAPLRFRPGRLLVRRLCRHGGRRVRLLAPEMRRVQTWCA